MRRGGPDDHESLDASCFSSQIAKADGPFAKRCDLALIFSILYYLVGKFFNE